MIRALLLAIALASPVVAQDTPEGGAVEEYDPDAVDGAAPDQPTIVIPDVPANDVRAIAGVGVELKGLDKVSGEVVDLELGLDEPGQVGRLEVTVSHCRYPEDNPAGEGYAWLTIRDPARDAVLFQGWMVASSPALNALDHPRYDIWVIRCTTA